MRKRVSLTSNHAIDWTPDQRCWSVPVALRASVAGHRERYAALSRGELLRGAQQRMMAHGQDIPPQGAAEIF